MKIKQVLTHAAKQLSSVCETPQLDAELLLQHILEVPRSHLHTWPNNDLSDEQYQQYQISINRRLNCEPIAYITGTKEFWSLPLHVTPDTLIPRPETELLVELILNRFQTKDNLTLADLGTGSGAIAIALAHEKPTWQITATDKSKKALDVAIENAKSLQITNIHFICGDWLTPLAGKRFDVIVSNPPYISHEEWAKCVMPANACIQLSTHHIDASFRWHDNNDKIAYQPGLKYEPISALLANNHGLADIENIVIQAASNLNPNGLLILEHGFQQGEQIRNIFVSAGYKAIETLCDFASQERVTLGYY